MRVPNMPDISAILNQKIAEIQSRLPVKMKTSGIKEVSFAEELNKATAQAAASVESAAPVIDPSLLDVETKSASKTSKTKFPLVSGSYESVYPRLSQVEIQELMPRINSAIETYSKAYGLDPLLVRAVIKEESGFQPFALSTSGAMGLMQLMPGTAEGLGITDAYNIEQNILGGTQYLYYQLKAFDGDLDLALAAYNAGPNAVRQYGGIPPYEQTQNYVRKVLNTYRMYQALEGN
ncbi:MAG TPA: lytic transglycosylase domain-containing protein [Clostridiaceae bacterium]|jgi:soluble lytic murein transglycosylase-like protein|nr:lytic transglycosylase domain-containing protein [Clostridiaceae bacterium]